MARIIVIDDAADILAFCRKRNIECHEDAYSAFRAMLYDQEPVDFVYLDYWGIEMHGIDAHLIAWLCLRRKIPFMMTSSDEVAAMKFKNLYGCKVGSKMDLMRECLKGHGAWAGNDLKQTKERLE